MVTVPCHAVAARDRVIICSNAARRGCQTTLTTTTTYHYMAASVAAKPGAAGWITFNPKQICWRKFGDQEISPTVLCARLGLSRQPA
ncbi:hypothetical protein AOLI_G00000690 [Acnodon oligacanthus]